MLLTSSLRKYTSNEQLHSMTRPWKDVVHSLLTTTWHIFSPPYKWSYETGGVREPVWDQPVRMCYASPDLKAKPSQSIVGFSVLCLGMRPHLTPLSPCCMLAYVWILSLSRTYLGSHILQYPGYSFSVTSGRPSLTTDFLFQCLLESFPPFFLMFPEP